VARVTCSICESRPVRRFCPGTRGDICTICCGTERENSIDCPFDCEYLQEARKHEKPAELDPKSVPNADIRVSDEFLSAQHQLVVACGRILFAAAVETDSAIDNDVREAIDALIRTLRTAESGLIYESRPANPLAASVQAHFQQELEKMRQDVAARTGVHSIRDKDVLGVLAFWQRMELRMNNGRRRGRAFIDSLIGLMPHPDEVAPS
jgi:hypothetical protein